MSSVFFFETGKNFRFYLPVTFMDESITFLDLRGTPPTAYPQKPIIDHGAHRKLKITSIARGLAVTVPGGASLRLHLHRQALNQFQNCRN